MLSLSQDLLDLGLHPKSRRFQIKNQSLYRNIKFIEALYEESLALLSLLKCLDLLSLRLCPRTQPNGVITDLPFNVPKLLKFITLLFQELIALLISIMSEFFAWRPQAKMLPNGEKRCYVLDSHTTI